MLSIRLATPDDAPAMLAVYAPYVENTAVTFEYEVPTPEEFRRRVETVLTRFPWLLVQDEAGAVYGYAYASPYHPRAAYRWDAEGSIYLRPEVQGIGLAAPLYRCLIALLERQSIRSFYGCITHPNPASEAFHRRLGFVDLAVYPRSGYKLGRWWDVLWNYLPLGPGDDTPPDPFRPFPELPPGEIAPILSRANREIEGCIPKNSLPIV